MKQSTLSFKEIILWEDNDFVLVNKPPFLATLEDRHERNNLLAMAREYVETAQVCHRLDKDTSGVLAIAKNPAAYRHMSMQFEHRQINKIYHAIADGIHNFKDELVDAPILKQEEGAVKISKRDGKPAQTYFTSLKSYKHHTLIECRPITGRMHQIRVHLSLLKSPITGDEMYGGKLFYLSSVKRGFNLKKDSDEQPLIKRMALHAHALEFLNMEGVKEKIIAPYPKDIQALIRQLEVNS